ncbi:hypothetical protein OC861_006021 [Tilletia horrida]|nr:hypothetical protein OC861_006021 [Tilletia horrida]
MARDGQGSAQNPSGSPGEDLRAQELNNQHIELSNQRLELNNQLLREEIQRGQRRLAELVRYRAQLSERLRQMEATVAELAEEMRVTPPP